MRSMDAIPSSVVEALGRLIDDYRDRCLWYRPRVPSGTNQGRPAQVGAMTSGQAPQAESDACGAARDTQTVSSRSRLPNPEPDASTA